MLPSSKSGDNPTGTTQRRRSGNQLKYLTNEMLSTDPRPATILAVRTDEENRFGPRVVCKLALNGQTIFWGVNIKRNPNYELMEKQFGLEENNWVGKKILLFLEQDEFSENYFTRVSFPPAGKPGRKGED